MVALDDQLLKDSHDEIQKRFPMLKVTNPQTLNPNLNPKILSPATLDSEKTPQQQVRKAGADLSKDGYMKAITSQVNRNVLGFRV
jgi:hypothetical protein